MNQGRSSLPLYIFTNSFPYGSGEQFFENELQYLSNSFNEIYLIPNHFGGNRQLREVPPNVRVANPLLPEAKGRTLLKEVFNLSPFLFIFHEIYSKKYYQSPALMIECLREGLRVRAYLTHPVVKKLRKGNTTAIVYSYWGYKSALICIFLISDKVKKIVRFHGSDLYENMHKMNIAFFRERMLSAIHTAVFVSDYGAQYLKQKYLNVGFRSMVQYLGVKDYGISTINHSKTLRIVSCSALVPVKRVHLIAEALLLIHSLFEIEWTHIGEGPLEEDVFSIARQFPSNIVFRPLGSMSNQSLREMYIREGFDLFINVSSSEGIPVAIMEAISSGIPVIATQVGGIPEIVGNELGYLLEPDFNTNDLAKLIIEFHSLSESAKVEKRKAARAKWAQLFNADHNNQQLTDLLLHKD